MGVAVAFVDDGALGRAEGGDRAGGGGKGGAFVELLVGELNLDDGRDLGGVNALLGARGGAASGAGLRVALLGSSSLNEVCKAGKRSEKGAKKVRKRCENGT